jgi:hypothetical protein
MAQNLQIRRAPSGVVIAEKAVDFFTESDITLDGNFKTITFFTINLVEDVQSEQLSLVSFTANVAGAFTLPSGTIEAQLLFEPVVLPPIPSMPSSRVALVAPFLPDLVFVALNGSGTFGATPDGPIKVSLQMKVTGGATGIVKPTVNAGGIIFNTVFAGITF